MKRNRNKDGSYNAWRATSLYLCRRKKSYKTYWLDKDEPLKEAVCQGFDPYWSPEIIAAKHNEANPKFPVGHRIIYRVLKRAD